MIGQYSLFSVCEEKPCVTLPFMNAPRGERSISRLNYIAWTIPTRAMKCRFTGTWSASFCWCGRGTFALSADGEEFLGKPGDCFFLPGGVIHGGKPEQCVYRCLVFGHGSLFAGQRRMPPQVCLHTGQRRHIFTYHPAGSPAAAWWTSCSEAWRRKGRAMNL